MGLIYTGGQFSSNIAGRLDPDGRVYVDQFGGTAVGRVEGNTIHADAFGYKPVGRVEPDGSVYEENGFQPIGKVEADGTVKAGQSFSQEQVGRVEPPNMLEAGAALLLLLR